MMKIIKTRKKLATLMDKNNDLRINDDLLFEFSPKKSDVRDIFCHDITLKKDGFSLDFNCRDFNGKNFIGGNFIGGKISYYAFFCLYGKFVKHGKIIGRHKNAHPPIELENERSEG